MGIVLGVMGVICLKVDPSVLTNEYLFIWALFSIADALWARLIFGRK
jgi:hypothetical protein